MGIPSLEADSRGVTLYDEEGFRGNRQEVYRDEARLSRRDPVGDDRTRSIRVDRGCEAVLYSQPNFRGRSMVVTRDESSLRRTQVGIDEVSSLRVDCRDSRRDHVTKPYDRHDRSDRYDPYDDELRYGEGALLFADKHFRGPSILVDRDIPHLGRTPIGNDRLTSIKVARGCVANLYRHKDYGGDHITVRHSVDHLGETRIGNDEVSSIRIDCRGDYGDDFRGVVLYRDKNFKGPSEHFDRDDPLLRGNPIGNDEVSSVRVSPGCRVTLFRDKDYRGRSMTLTDDVRNLKGSPVGNDAVSSLQVDCRRRSSWDHRDRGDRRYDRDADHHGVTLYAEDGFRGSSQSFRHDEPNLRRTPFGNDRARSVRVPRGCRVTLYSDADYRGRSVTLGYDERRLAITRVGANAVSSLRVDCGRR